MSQILLKAKLINVDSSNSQNGTTWRLIFQSQKYDKGLDQIVPCSLNVKIIEDHVHLLEFYRSYKGREIYLPVDLSTMDRNIYYRTTADGKPLQITEQKDLKATA